jgi:anhydro-N-acetylmuramic acid kinase
MLEVILAQLKVSILPVEDEVIDFKEALCFAYLGLLAAQGRPNVLKTVTGARISSLCGAIHLPDNPEIRYILLPENQ